VVKDSAVIKEPVVIKEFVVIMHCGCRSVGRRRVGAMPPQCMITTGDAATVRQRPGGRAMPPQCMITTGRAR
jgi:hypothetical protein